MVGRLGAVIGIVAAVVLLSAPAFGVETVSERKERLRREALNLPQQASEALQAKDADRAIELFTKAIDAKAFEGEILGKIYFGRGSAYRLKKDCVNAMADYNKAIELVQLGDLYFARGACFIDLKEEDKALTELDAAVKTDPKAMLYREARCILLFNRKDYAGALPDCEMALTASPDNKNMLLAVSQAAEQTGNKARAAEAYRKLLQVDPGNPTATDGLKRVGG